MSASFDNDPEFTGITPKPNTVRTFPFGKFLLSLAIIAVVLAFFLPATRSVRPAARRLQCMSNLKQITLALINYEQVYGVFPPACTVDEGGKPLHSWRTLILPYLEQGALYETIDLSKPWNDPANARAAATELVIFNCPEEGKKNTTPYLAIVGDGEFLASGRPRRKGEITDDHGATLAVIEVGEGDAVPWMSPFDADAGLVMRLGANPKLPHPGGMNAALVDGRVWFMQASIRADVLRSLLTIAGGEIVSNDTW